MKSDLQTAIDHVITLAKREGRAEFIREIGGHAPKARKPRKVVAKAAPKAKPVKATKKQAPRAVGQKRDSALLEALVAGLRAHIEAHPGESIEAIGKVLGVKTKDLALPVKKLLKDGKLRVEGRKRATKYFAAEKVKANGVTRTVVPVIEEANAE